MNGYTLTKYLILPKRQPNLHIVAYKGGDRINTMCGETFGKRGCRTVMKMPPGHYVCAACSTRM